MSIKKTLIFRSDDEKRKWLQDLYEAIDKAKINNDEKQNYNSLKSNSKGFLILNNFLNFSTYF